MHAELRYPSSDDEPAKVVGIIRVRWQTLTESLGRPRWAARIVPGGASWEPATTVDEVDVEIDDTVVRDRGKIIVRTVSPTNRGSYWVLSVHPAHTRWLARIELLPQEIPTPRELRGT